VAIASTTDLQRAVEEIVAASTAALPAFDWTPVPPLDPAEFPIEELVALVGEGRCLLDHPPGATDASTPWWPKNTWRPAVAMGAGALRIQPERRWNCRGRCSPNPYFQTAAWTGHLPKPCDAQARTVRAHGDEITSSRGVSPVEHWAEQQLGVNSALSVAVP